MSLPRADFKMVLGEEDGAIPQNFGSVRLVGGESLVSHRTVFSKDSKYVIYLFVYVTRLGQVMKSLNYLFAILQNLVLLLWSTYTGLQRFNWRFITGT